MHKSERTYHSGHSKLPDEEVTLLDCPQCASFISSVDINQKNKIAKCSHCDHVFSFVEDGYWDPFGIPGETMPAGLELLKLPSFLDIRINHYESRSGSIWPLMLFSGFWNIVLLVSVVVMFRTDTLASLPFISLHLLAGLYLLWQLFGTLFNKTSIHIDEQKLCMHTKPFKINSRKCYHRKNIVQLDTYRMRVKTKNGHTYKEVLSIRLNNGKNPVLLQGLDTNTLQHVEKEIEKYLGLVNVPHQYNG